MVARTGEKTVASESICPTKRSGAAARGGGFRALDCVVARRMAVRIAGTDVGVWGALSVPLLAA
jgi:hypothetical protein